MADTIRRQILDALGVRAAQVRLPGGTAALNICYARQTLAAAELPALVITPQEESAERRYGQDLITMPVSVSVAAVLGAFEPLTLAEAILGELRSVFPAPLEGLAEDIRYAEGGVNEWPERQDQAIVVTAVFNIVYSTAANDPFNT